MDGLQRFTAGVRLLVGRHPLRVWLLWAIAAVVLVLTPLALFDPAAWIFLVDPELAALVVLLGLASVRAGALRAVGFALRKRTR